jgi:hypothetical protein
MRNHGCTGHSHETANFRRSSTLVPAADDWIERKTPLLLRLLAGSGKSNSD